MFFIQEYFAYECLSVRDTEKLFQDEIIALCDAIKVSFLLNGNYHFLVRQIVSKLIKKFQQYFLD